MHKVKVLIADDSGVMRLLISDILKEYSGIEVVGTASNGKEAVEKVKSLDPDVLLLDMQMGEYDGKYAVKELMKDHPIPIVLLSSIGNTNMSPIVEALELGAFDYLNKPEKNNSKIRDIKLDIYNRINQASRADRNKLGSRRKILANHNPHSFVKNLPYNAIVIGSSTGGPAAVERVLTKLPNNMPVPVVVVQHMPANFVPSFVNRLNNIIPLDVVIGRKGVKLKPGRVIIVAGENNSVLVKNQNGEVEIDNTDDLFMDYNFPSVNSVFLSAAEVYKNKLIGVVLTGMGKDGAVGMKSIFENGGLTIAQDEKTSVVYGMPREVVENGDAKFVVPVYEIGGFIVSSLS